MSIKVTIEHPSGAFRRTLEIERTSTPLLDPNGQRDWQEVNQYAVQYRGGSEKTFRDATFSHRYGDDLATLFIEAVEAIGGLGGMELQR